MATLKAAIEKIQADSPEKLARDLREFRLCLIMLYDDDDIPEKFKRNRTAQLIEFKSRFVNLQCRRDVILPVGPAYIANENIADMVDRWYQWCLDAMLIWECQNKKQKEQDKDKIHSLSVAENKQLFVNFSEYSTSTNLAFITKLPKSYVRVILNRVTNKPNMAYLKRKCENGGGQRPGYEYQTIAAVEILQQTQKYSKK